MHRENTELNKKTMFKNLDEENRIINLQDFQFGLAFSFNMAGIDDSYGRLRVNQIEQRWVVGEDGPYRKR